ncbi:hypothetical protein EON63_12320 [archaeon]|nr:MAG: hypothetical protein EON63_12320 [archaeon]
MNRELSDHQRELLTQFREIVNLQDEDRSVNILTRYDWDLQRAVEGYMSQVSQGVNPTRANPYPQQSSGVTPSTGSGLYDLLFYPLRWLFQTHPLSLNPNQDTTRFLTDFHERYPSVQLPFFQSSYASAVQQTFSQSRFLLVYLHSPMHDDTDTYVRSVLGGTSRLNPFITQHHINVWAGRVWDAEAYSLSIQLQASAYPFMALLLPQSNRMVQIVEKVTGDMKDTEVLSVLERGMEGFREVLQRNRLENERRLVWCMVCWYGHVYVYVLICVFVCSGCMLLVCRMLVCYM